MDFFKQPKCFHIVMELAEGGDVFERLAKRKVYTEKDARDLAKRMLERSVSDVNVLSSPSTVPVKFIIAVLRVLTFTHIAFIS